MPFRNAFQETQTRPNAVKMTIASLAHTVIYWSPGRFALQLTILTLSAMTGWPPFSILNETFLIRKVHTSSQKR